MATAALTAEPSLRESSLGTPRWLHAIAVATAFTALPLLFLGAEVTTKQVGLVDQQGLRQPWHMFTEVSKGINEHGMRFFADGGNWGLLIEHSHRTFGWLVGMCAIALALGLGFFEKNRWLRWMGLVGLVTVSCQGVLGILRVNLHALAGREFAMIHGCTAQIVFALLVSIAYLTASVWKNGFGGDLPGIPSDLRLRRLGLLTTGLVYLQIVVGAVMRHTDAVIGPRIHLLLAFAVVASAATLGAVCWTSKARDARLARLLMILSGLVAVQLLLGVEAWLCKFTTNGQWVQLKPLTTYPDLARSLHLLIGSLLFANTVVITLRVYLGRSMATLPAATSARQLEGAA